MTGEIRYVTVVDDEKVIAETLAIILRAQGYIVKTYADPLKALECLGSPFPDLLLTDISMPGLNGIELALTLRVRCPDCKVLIFTGQPQWAGHLRVREDEGKHFRCLSKPVHPTTLLETRFRAAVGSQISGRCPESLASKTSTVCSGVSLRIRSGAKRCSAGTLQPLKPHLLSATRRWLDCRKEENIKVRSS